MEYEGLHPLWMNCGIFGHYKEGCARKWMTREVGMDIMGKVNESEKNLLKKLGHGCGEENQTVV